MFMKELSVIENSGQRVLTTAQLAEAYETESKTISNNFANNRDRYSDGKHFYCLEGDELKAFKHDTENLGLAANINKLYLWTEKGVLLHAKSLNTDKAWEVYDHLVETYFNVREQKQSVFSELSPQLQLLINIETEQKKQAKAIEAVNTRIDNIGDVISLDKNSWRKDSQSLVSRIATAIGGFENIRDCYNEVYRLAEDRAGVSLATRLTNKRNRMAGEGICKSQRDKLTKVDIIGDDKKLIEIYVAIVKEMAIKHGVCN